MATHAKFTASRLLEAIAADASYRQQFSSEQINLLQSIAFQVIESAPRTHEGDIWIYRIVVTLLGGTVLLVSGGVIWLFHSYTDGIENFRVPDILTAIGSASVGALAGLLSPTSGR